MDVELLKNEGNQLFTKQKFAEAAEVYEKALGLLSQNQNESEDLKFTYILYTNLCICNFNQKQFDLAMKNAENAIKWNPKWEKAHFYQGKIHLLRSQYKKARESFAKCLDISPTNSTSLLEFENAERKYIENHYKADVANSPIQVKFLSKSAGKAVFATTTFEYGDTIFIETPAVSHKYVKPETRQCCSHCLKSFLSSSDFSRLKDAGFNFNTSIIETMTNKRFLNCKNCLKELYCSEKCLTDAWNAYHQVLCPGNDDSHPIVQLENLAKKLNRTNILLITRILGMAIQQYKTANKDSAFEMLEAFLANQEASEGDSDAVLLLQQAVKDLKPYNDNIL